MSRETCCKGREGLQNFVRNIKGAVLFSTGCMNMMLLKMFNWCIFKISCSLKIYLACANLFLLKIIRIACFCWLLIFLRFVLQVLPQAILAQFMQVSIYEQQRASKAFLSKKCLALKIFCYFVFCIFNVFFPVQVFIQQYSEKLNKFFPLNNIITDSQLWYISYIRGISSFLLGLWKKEYFTFLAFKESLFEVNH